MNILDLSENSQVDLFNKSQAFQPIPAFSDRYRKENLLVYLRPHRPITTPDELNIPPELRDTPKWGNITWLVDQSWETFLVDYDNTWIGNSVQDVLVDALGTDPGCIMYASGGTSAGQPWYNLDMKAYYVNPWPAFLVFTQNKKKYASFIRGRIAAIESGHGADTTAVCHARRISKPRVLMMAALTADGHLPSLHTGWGGATVNPMGTTLDDTLSYVGLMDIGLVSLAEDWWTKPGGSRHQENLADSIDYHEMTTTGFNIVCESYYNDSIFLTEKTYKPLASLQPFVLQGPAGCVAELRSQGYVVFDDLIDHSYDLEVSRVARWQALRSEINRLMTLPWNTILPKILPDLLKNYETFMKASQTNYGWIPLENINWKWEQNYLRWRKENR